MKDPTGRSRGVWFWVGVVLLSISASFWSLLVYFIVGGANVLQGIIIGLVLTVGPIAIGIYCIRRSGKAPEQLRGWVKAHEGITKDDQTEVVVRQALWIVIIAWLMLLLGLWVLGIVLVGRGGEWVPALVGIGSIFIFLGVRWVWMTTRIRFNQPPGHLTVTRGYIPLFFWFLRRKVISKEEARSAQSDVQMTGGGLYSSKRIKCEVKVRTSAGRSVTLFSHSSLNTRGRLAEIAEHLTRRIQEFSEHSA